MPGLRLHLPYNPDNSLFRRLKKEASIPFTKYRNMWLQVLFYVLTFVIYGIYWYMVSLQEMQRANAKGASGCLWTFLLFVPIVSLLTYWRQASEYCSVCRR